MAINEAAAAPDRHPRHRGRAARLATHGARHASPRRAATIANGAARSGTARSRSRPAGSCPAQQVPSRRPPSQHPHSYHGQRARCHPVSPRIHGGRPIPMLVRIHCSHRPARRWQTRRFTATASPRRRRPSGQAALTVGRRAAGRVRRAGHRRHRQRCSSENGIAAAFVFTAAGLLLIAGLITVIVGRCPGELSAGRAALPQNTCDGSLRSRDGDRDRRLPRLWAAPSPPPSEPRAASSMSAITRHDAGAHSRRWTPSCAARAGEGAVLQLDVRDMRTAVERAMGQRGR